MLRTAVCRSNSITFPSVYCMLVCIDALLPGRRNTTLCNRHRMSKAILGGGMTGSPLGFELQGMLLYFDLLWK